MKASHMKAYRLNYSLLVLSFDFLQCNVLQLNCECVEGGARSHQHKECEGQFAGFPQSFTVFWTYHGLPNAEDIIQCIDTFGSEAEVWHKEDNLHKHNQLGLLLQASWTSIACFLLFYTTDPACRLPFALVKGFGMLMIKLVDN